MDEIRDLYSALQELVPSQARPQPTSPYGAIPEETSTSRTGRSKVDTVEYDTAPSSSNPSSEPAFIKRHRCSSPLPLRSQPKVIQRKRSNSCFAISAAPNSLAPPSTDFLNAKSERRNLSLSTKSQRINEELSNLIDNFGKEKTCRTTNEKNYLRTDSSEVEDSSSKRRYSGGDLLGERREKLKDPKARMRRRSIGGSLLLNAIIKSDSSQQDSLANALSIVARKDELQEITKTCQDNLEQMHDSSGVSDDYDEVDGRPQQQLTPRNPEIDDFRSSIKEHQDVVGNSSSDKEKESNVKTQGGVGAEMHNLLEALQGLVVTGEGTTPPPSSQPCSRRTSWVEKCSPKRKESLDDLEAFFKTKLDEISEKENVEGSSKGVQSQTNAETTKILKNKKTDNGNTKQVNKKNGFRRSSSAEQYTGGSSSIHRSQSTVEFLSPSRAERRVGARRASVQIEVNRTNRGKSNSSLEVISHESSSKSEKKLTTRLKNFSSRSRRRKSDIPIIRKEEVLFESTDAEETRKRALWKEDQEVFAKQVNQRLQDWLERATALSLSTAENTEDDSASQVSIDTNPDSSKEESVKTKRSKFGIKKAFKGRIKRSKSLHNLLEPEEIQVEKPKSSSPLMERSKQNLRKLGQFRLPRSMPSHNVAAMKPKFDQVDTKSTESDESNESSSSNIRRSAIWYDDDSSPEMIPKVKAIDISGENLNLLRRRSCPTPKNNFVNNSIDSKRIPRLPVDLPLFYAPGREASNPLRIQKKVENCRQNSSEKENKMPRVSKALFPVRKGIVKNELFYNEPRAAAAQLFPYTLSPPTIPQAKPSCSNTSDDVEFMMFQNYDLSKLSVSNDFESFEDFRDRTKSTESEDSGCPNTSDYC